MAVDFIMSELHSSIGEPKKPKNMKPKTVVESVCLQFTGAFNGFGGRKDCSDFAGKICVWLGKFARIIRLLLDQVANRQTRSKVN